jgi:hypothetical protein
MVWYGMVLTLTAVRRIHRGNGPHTSHTHHRRQEDANIHKQTDSISTIQYHINYHHTKQTPWKITLHPCENSLYI